ncbi:hypothetical protein TrRE_jg152, partial [Triparma retinervis]
LYPFHSNPLESYFPFDPLLLRKTHVWIDGGYREWGEWGASGGESSDSDSSSGSESDSGSSDGASRSSSSSMGSSGGGHMKGEGFAPMSIASSLGGDWGGYGEEEERDDLQADREWRRKNRIDSVASNPDTW